MEALRWLFVAFCAPAGAGHAASVGSVHGGRFRLHMDAQPQAGNAGEVGLAGVVEEGMKEGSVFSVMTMEQIEAVAKSFNCEVLVAKPDELQFDLDSPEAESQFAYFYHIKLASRFKGLLELTEWKSKSGKKHAVITLPCAFSVEERIAMQAMGGSDYGREFAALCCHMDGSPHPILLFRPIAGTAK